MENWPIISENDESSKLHDYTWKEGYILSVSNCLKIWFKERLIM